MILELGPEFIVTGKADAPSNVGASASIAYNLSVLATTFRPQCGSTGDTFNQGASGAFLPLVASSLPFVSCTL
jgi:hypothetical protein